MMVRTLCPLLLFTANMVMACVKTWGDEKDYAGGAYFVATAVLFVVLMGIHRILEELKHK